jgi:hypothetical protein
VLGGCGIGGPAAGAGVDEDGVDGDEDVESFNRSTSDCLGYGKLAAPSSASGGGGMALAAWEGGEEADEHAASAGSTDIMTRITAVHRPLATVQPSVER